jgi:hypothetical protein
VNSSLGFCTWCEMCRRSRTYVYSMVCCCWNVLFSCCSWRCPLRGVVCMRFSGRIPLKVKKVTLFVTLYCDGLLNMLFCSFISYINIWHILASIHEMWCYVYLKNLWSMEPEVLHLFFYIRKYSTWQIWEKIFDMLFSITVFF